MRRGNVRLRLLNRKAIDAALLVAPPPRPALRAGRPSPQGGGWGHGAVRARRVSGRWSPCARLELFVLPDCSTITSSGPSSAPVLHHDRPPDPIRPSPQPSVNRH